MPDTFFRLYHNVLGYRDTVAITNDYDDIMEIDKDYTVYLSMPLSNSVLHTFQ